MQKGFSLVELLVVIVIIALGSSLTVAWLTDVDPADRLRHSGRELAARFELAARVATARQRVVGWQPLAQGYRFVVWQPTQGWQPWGASVGLEARHWEQPLHPSRYPPIGDDTITPWLIWFPDGEVLGARLMMESEDARLALDVDALGVHLTGGSR